MKNYLYTKRSLILLLPGLFVVLFALTPLGSPAGTVSAACEASPKQVAGSPTSTVSYPKQAPAGEKPVLTWTKVAGAVAYEIEFMTQAPDRAAGQQPNVFFSTRWVYVNGYNADFSAYPSLRFCYWRVRGLDLDGNPLSPFSAAEKIYIDRTQKNPVKPLITAEFNQERGSVLLYPVYAWIPVAGTNKYEVEILDDMPENPNGTTPSVHRIASGIATGFDYYDEQPRAAEKPLYWRVRGVDEAGNSVGVFSDVGKFGVNPNRDYTVATFGDSITHGGGAVSYSPADWEYSYQHYLDFSTINLGHSGDTSETAVARFDQDVIPFHPQYLIILTGTNSIRGGTPAESVIADLAALRDKCLQNNIVPVFLTIPPINPENIARVFNQPTAPDWQRQRRLVNAFIRSQQYFIDVARGMADSEGNLPTRLAIDGLHLDIEGKQRMADVINREWPLLFGKK